MTDASQGAAYRADAPPRKPRWGIVRTPAVLQRAGAMVRAARKAKGLSLRKASDITGKSHVFLGEIERGEAGLPVALAYALADTYGMDIAVVLCAFRVVPDAAAERFFDVDRMRAALAGEAKRDEWLCGYAAALGAMARHDASVRTVMTGDGITLAKLRAAGVEDFDMRDIERAFAGGGR